MIIKIIVLDIEPGRPVNRKLATPLVRFPELTHLQLKYDQL